MEKYTELTLRQYLDELASDKPVPGGGSVSAYVTALALGLTQMVGRISLKRKKKDETPEAERAESERKSKIEQILKVLEKARHDALPIVDQDPKIYKQVMDLWKEPEKLEAALAKSFQIQADLAFLALRALEWNSEMAELVSGSIKNDLIVSASLAHAGFEGAYHTAMINVRYMKSHAHRDRAEEALTRLALRFEEEKARKICL